MKEIELNKGPTGIEGPTEAEIGLAADVLSRLPIGRLPLPIFEEVAVRSVLTAYELVIFRFRENKLQVLLLQRDSNDPWWPDEWHSPGIILTPEDASFEGAHKRLIDSELSGAIKITRPSFVDDLILDTKKRGIENAHIVWSMVQEGDPEHGEFFDVGNLPSDLIDHHHPILEAAISNYKNSQNLHV